MYKETERKNCFLVHLRMLAQLHHVI